MADADPARSARDTSRDGLRNKVENYVLANFAPFWGFVNRQPGLARFFNKLIVDNAVLKAPYRPLALSAMTPYTSWASLTDRTWFNRYLPPKDQSALPDAASVAGLFKLRPDRAPRISDRSTLLFPSMAQWFTDGFLMTDDADRRRTRTNHQIDLSQLYGLNEAVTHALREHSEQAGRKGRLASTVTATGEWAPALYDARGQRKPEFAAIPDPVHLPQHWPAEKLASIFAFGGERANSTTYTAAINTLFLREHNRLCAELERNNPAWDDERVFQTARNINIVELIKIVVEEYINHISPYWFKLLADPAPCYTAVWNRENWIPVEFNLLYRWHSLVPDQARWNETTLQLADLRFDNRMMLSQGLAATFVSASQSPAWRLGMFNTLPMLDGIDRASIEQGRRNELASYNDYREAMNYPRVTRFEQISGDPLVVSELRRIYGDVDRVEFYAGLFAEDPPPRSAVPPLIGRMVAADAFSHALTNPLLSPHVYNETTFTTAGLREIDGALTIRHILHRQQPLEHHVVITMDRGEPKIA